MSDWRDLEEEFRRAIVDLSQSVAQTCLDCAAIYTMTLDGTVPIGDYGSMPLLRDAMLKTGELEQGEGFATIGISPLSLLGDPDDDPPRGTIRDFLVWWGTTEPEEEEEIPTLGTAEPFFHPWWSLSDEQKEALEEQREAGMFGGKPPMAPYWWVQEEGNTKALVLGQHYIATAWQNALPKMDARVANIKVL